VHERYRRQTDGRAISYSEREFTFANKNALTRPPNINQTINAPRICQYFTFSTDVYNKKPNEQLSMNMLNRYTRKQNVPE